MLQMSTHSSSIYAYMIVYLLKQVSMYLVTNTANRIMPENFYGEIGLLSVSISRNMLTMVMMMMTTMYKTTKKKLLKRQPPLNRLKCRSNVKSTTL